MSTLKKLNINLNTLKSEAQKFKTELTKVSKQLKPQAQEKLHQAEAMYKNVVSRLKVAQSELDKELGQTVTMLKKVAKQAEATLKKATKAGPAKKAKTTKKATTKKVTKKATKKTSKKSV